MALSDPGHQFSTLAELHDHVHEGIVFVGFMEPDYLGVGASAAIQAKMPAKIIETTATRPHTLPFAPASSWRPEARA